MLHPIFAPNFAGKTPQAPVDSLACGPSVWESAVNTEGPPVLFQYYQEGRARKL